MKAVKRICAVIIGFVFIVAGLLKLMDPIGAGLVVREYFNFLHLDFLAPASNFFGVFFAILEAFVGAALISGVFPKGTAVLAALLTLAFTVLTFIMWLTNPNMECGCFGEAIHLTHFQSFIKNVALCVLLAVAYIPPSATPKPRKVKYVSFSIVVISIIVFAVYFMMSIPVMDFTPFAPGATLMQAEQTPDPDAPLLSICDAEGEYCDEILASGDLLLLTFYDSDILSEASVRRVLDCAGQARTAGVEPVFISSAAVYGIPSAYSSDRRTLMTVNRSNGGATLLRDGMVVAKWPFRSLPAGDRLQELVQLDRTESMVKENTPKRLKLQGFLLYVFAVLLLL